MKAIIIENPRTTFKQVSKILDLLQKSRGISEIVSIKFLSSLFAPAWCEENDRPIREFDTWAHAAEYADSIILFGRHRLVKEWALEANLKITEIGEG